MSALAALPVHAFALRALDARDTATPTARAFASAATLAVPAVVA